MRKKAIYLVFFLAIMTIAAVFYARKTTAPAVRIDNPAVSEVAKSEEKNPVADTKEFFVAGWLPYWKKTQGVDSLDGKLNLFSEINPFAFGVNEDGSLIDDTKIDSAPWPQLFADAKKANVKIVPTILWGDADEMHNIFSDSDLINSHINTIVSMLEKYGFSGVDIDYEGKDIADRDNFSSFIKALHARLAAENRTLSCTVEARTQDLPTEGFEGTRAMSWANDFNVLNYNCDMVRIMAYDEDFQIWRAQSFQNMDQTPYAPNADISWVRDVMEYAMRYIAPEKLVMGVATYGWEFSLTKLPTGYHYEKFKSISYPDAMEEAREAGVTPQRNVGGELDFVYDTANGQHLVTFSDAEAIQQKIDLAKSLHLKGISLFKIDGLTDPQLFNVLKAKE